MLTYMASKIGFNHYVISLYQSNFSLSKKDEKTGLDWTSKHYIRRLLSVMATLSSSSCHGCRVCMIHGHCLPCRPPHPHPCPCPPCHCHHHPCHLCPHPPRHHQWLCHHGICHGHHIIIVVIHQCRGRVVAALSMQVAGSLLLLLWSSVNTEGGWWLHY